MLIPQTDDSVCCVLFFVFLIIFLYDRCWRQAPVLCLVSGMVCLITNRYGNQTFHCLPHNKSNSDEVSLQEAGEDQ